MEIFACFRQRAAIVQSQRIGTALKVIGNNTIKVSRPIRGKNHFYQRITCDTNYVYSLMTRSVSGLFIWPWNSYILHFLLFTVWLQLPPIKTNVKILITFKILYRIPVEVLIRLHLATLA